MRRCREEIEQEIKETKERLSAYLEKEKEMLSGGAKHYRIGTRELDRYDPGLKAIQNEIAKLKQRLRELYAERDGRKPRRVVGIVLRDW